MNVSAMRNRWGRGLWRQSWLLFASSNSRTPYWRKTCHNIFISVVDMFLSASLELSCRQSLTWEKCDLSGNCFGSYEVPAVSLVGRVRPRQGVAHCWFIARRQPGFDPRNSGWEVPPTTAQNNTCLVKNPNSAKGYAVRSAQYNGFVV